MGGTSCIVSQPSKLPILERDSIAPLSRSSAYSLLRAFSRGLFILSHRGPSFGELFQSHSTPRAEHFYFSLLAPYARADTPAGVACQDSRDWQFVGWEEQSAHALVRQSVAS